MGKKLVLIGGGGHCKSIISSIDTSVYSDIIITEIAESVGKEIDGVRVAGTDDDLMRFFAEGYTDAFIALGSVSASRKRMMVYDKIKSIGFSFPSIIDKTAAVADSAEIGSGVFIGKNAVVNAGAKIGDFTIINSGAVVDHDCCIGNFAHISPGVTLSGGVTAGNFTHIGTGSCVKQYASIGENTTIGMGSVVICDIPSNCTAFGVPCRVIK